MTARRATARSLRRQGASRRTAAPSRRFLLLTTGALVVGLGGVAAGVVATQDRSPQPASAQTAATPASDAPVPDPTPTTAAARWKADALAHFRPMNSVLFALVTTASQWQQHKATDDAVRSLLAKDLPAVEQTRSELNELQPYPAAPHALADLQSAVELYTASFQVLEAATRATGPALRQQLSLGQQRLRLLGDRVFDQATKALQSLDGPERQVDGTVVQHQAEVPDWRSLALAAGPPLRPRTPAAAALRPFQSTRPTTSLTAWRSAVLGLHVPPAEAERTSLAGGNPATLDALSSRLEAASAQLWASPDPVGQRIESTRTQLSLLVHAEAVRTAEEAGMVPAGDRTTLLETAAAVARVGDALWSALLPGRTVSVPGGA